MEGGSEGGGGGGGFSVVNQVMLVGNLGSEPAVKYLDSGNCVLSISLAVNKELPPGAARGGEGGGTSEVDWIRVEAWGKIAENLAAGARKGSKVWVVGKLVTNSWVDKYGQNRSDLKVRVKRVEVLQTARTQMPAQQMGGGGYYQQQQQQQQWEGQHEDEPMMIVESYLGGGQQQLPPQQQQLQQYDRNKVPVAVPPVTAPYRKKSTYGNNGGGGGGGREGGEQYEVESYDVDTDIPF